MSRRCQRPLRDTGRVRLFAIQRPVIVIGKVFRITGWAAVLTTALVVAAGCSVQRPAYAPVLVSAQSEAKPLPFKGRLANGDPAELPPSVAMSLAKSSPITFSYREELTHDEYHIPLWFSALDPVTYVGAPLGDYGVTAFASLAITDGPRILGDYTAKVYVSRSYNLYSEPSHRELEQAARAAVRARIDQKLRRDANRLAQEVAAADVLPGAARRR